VSPSAKEYVLVELQVRYDDAVNSQTYTARVLDQLLRVSRFGVGGEGDSSHQEAVT
jgi:hypothetical protein